MQKKSRCSGFTLLFDGIIPICIAALTAFACIFPACNPCPTVDFDYFQGIIRALLYMQRVTAFEALKLYPGFADSRKTCASLGRANRVSNRGHKL